MVLGLCQSIGLRKSTERWPPSLPQRENEHETWTAFLLAEAVTPAWVAGSFSLGVCSTNPRQRIAGTLARDRERGRRGVVTPNPCALSSQRAKGSKNQK